jgi:membrane protein YqaA with SNARE-associated domain
MLKVLLYVFFLVAYVCWALACAKSLKKVQSDLLGGKSFWSSEVILLESLAGFFGFIYLLSGLWSLKLVLLIFIASHLGGLVAWALGSILGAQTKDAGIRTLWAGKEIDIKHPIAMITLSGICGVLSLSYPVVAGVIFFRHPWGSPVLQSQVVKSTLLLLNLSGYLLLVIVNGSMLASENLDDDTRQRIFINQLVGLIPAAIYVALAFWAFGLGGSPLALGFLGIPAQTISLQTLLLLLFLFAATVLIPYLAGTQRARRKSLELLGKVKGLVAELEDILESPTASLYVDKLNELHNKVIKTQSQFTDDDAMLAYEVNARQNPDKVPEADKSLVAGIEKTRDLDARFRFLEDLGKLENEIETIVADLQKRTETTIEDAARHWAEKFKGRKEELGKTIETASSKKPFITASAGALVSTIVLTILGEVAKTAWHWIMQAPK